MVYLLVGVGCSFRIHFSLVLLFNSCADPSFSGPIITHFAKSTNAQVRNCRKPAHNAIWMTTNRRGRNRKLVGTRLLDRTQYEDLTFSMRIAVPFGAASQTCRIAAGSAPKATGSKLLTAQPSGASGVSKCPHE